MKKVLLSIMLIVLFALIVGCSVDSDPITFTIYEGKTSASNFYSKLLTPLEDSSYTRLEIPLEQDALWKLIKSLMDNPTEHQWTNPQIFNWFLTIERNVDPAWSEEQYTWLKQVDSGFVAVCLDSVVYLILK